MSAGDLDDKILRAAQVIKEEMAERGEGDFASRLERALAMDRGDAESRRQAANRTLDLVIREPQAWRRLREELGPEALAADRLEFRFFEPLPGGSGAVPAGTLMVCPVDPSHYRRRLRQKGQSLTCPQHGTRLVPLLEE